MFCREDLPVSEIEAESKRAVLTLTIAALMRLIILPGVTCSCDLEISDNLISRVGSSFSLHLAIRVRRDCHKRKRRESRRASLRTPTGTTPSVGSLATETIYSLHTIP
jgi:hypothetical protein